MAELRDSHNHTVLHVDIEKYSAETLITTVRLVFQRNIFIDNNVGWTDEIRAELRWHKLPLMKHEVLIFINTAQDWIDLSLPELAVTFFSGIWNLDEDDDFGKFEIEVKPLFHSPTKTDGFTVRLDISNGHLWENTRISLRLYLLANFIRELTAAVYIED